MATWNKTKSWSSASKSGGGMTGKSGNAASGNAASGYAGIWNTLNCKIASYKTLCAQTTGTAKCSRPTQATLNSFSKWIEKGAVIHKVSPTQVRRWSKTTNQFKTSSSAKTALASCFGKSTIKAVACDKSGSFMVACSPTWKGGKKFNFPR